MKSLCNWAKSTARPKDRLSHPTQYLYRSATAALSVGCTRDSRTCSPLAGLTGCLNSLAYSQLSAQHCMTPGWRGRRFPRPCAPRRALTASASTPRAMRSRRWLPYAKPMAPISWWKTTPSYRRSCLSPVWAASLPNRLAPRPLPGCNAQWARG